MGWQELAGLRGRIPPQKLRGGPRDSLSKIICPPHHAGLSLTPTRPEGCEHVWSLCMQRESALAGFDRRHGDGQKNVPLLNVYRRTEKSRLTRPPSPWHNSWSLVSCRRDTFLCLIMSPTLM